MASPKETHRRLEVQGYKGLSEEAIHEIGSWFQFTPALNTALLAVGILTGSRNVLLLLAFLMGIGSIFAFHPFDILYNRIIRRFTRTRALPPSGEQRRFVFSIEGLLIIATTWLFTTGRYGTAFTIGCVLLALLLSLTLFNMCIVSEMLNKVFGAPGKKR